LLSEQRIRDEGFFDSSVVRAAWQDHLSGARNHGGGLWAILMFQAWLDQEAAESVTLRKTA